jgi:putative spermidine/putrescine transport system ATP-binding protein
VYERPATGFVAGFVGVSNVLEGEAARAITGDARAFTIRPEKISMAEPERSASAEEECTATGHVREVVYLGATTRYVVDLDAGGSLVVMEQNLTTSSMEALQVRGKAVRLVWDRRNNRQVEPSAGAEQGSDDPEEGTR